MKKLNVFIDGSCIESSIKEGNIGGWSYIVTDKEFNILTQNNGKIREGVQNSVRAELEALYQALLKMKTFKGNCKFHIYTDYDIIADSINGFCMRKANRDYWDLIEPLCIKLAGSFMVSHIYSHNKDLTIEKILRDFNDKADKLAKAGANSLLTIPVKLA